MNFSVSNTLSILYPWIICMDDIVFLVTNLRVCGGLLQCDFGTNDLKYYEAVVISFLRVDPDVCLM